jgi:hypothetical protein
MLLLVGEITLKILKEKPIKSIRIKAHLDISIRYPLGIKNLTKYSFQKDFENNLVQKSITTIWLRFY